MHRAMKGMFSFFRYNLLTWRSCSLAEKQKQQDFLSTGSFTRLSQPSELNQNEDRNREFHLSLLHEYQDPQTFKPSSVTFRMPSEGSRIRIKATRTQTCIHLRCGCHRKQLYLLCTLVLEGSNAKTVKSSTGR